MTSEAGLQKAMQLPYFASVFPGVLDLGTVKKQNRTDYILKILLALFDDSRIG